MRHLIKAAAGIAAAVAMASAVAAAGAAAATMTVSPAGGFTASSTLTFTDSSGLLINLACPVTLTGSWRTGPISLTAGSSVGQITGGSVGSCTGGSAVLLTPTPWAIAVGGGPLGSFPYTGILYSVTVFSVQIVVVILGIRTTCLYAGIVGKLVELPRIWRSTYLGSPSIARSSGSGACPSTAKVEGLLSISPEQRGSIAI